MLDPQEMCCFEQVTVKLTLDLIKHLALNTYGGRQVYYGCTGRTIARGMSRQLLSMTAQVRF
jgi:hypothetical protein